MSGLTFPNIPHFKPVLLLLLKAGINLLFVPLTLSVRSTNGGVEWLSHSYKLWRHLKDCKYYKIWWFSDIHQLRLGELGWRGGDWWFVILTYEAVMINYRQLWCERRSGQGCGLQPCLAPSTSCGRHRHLPLCLWPCHSAWPWQAKWAAMSHYWCFEGCSMTYIRFLSPKDEV